MRESTRTGVAFLSRRTERPGSLALKQIVDELVVALGDDVVRKPLDLEGEPHVELTTTTPFVNGKGWLNFIGGFHHFAAPGGGAHWVSAIAPAGAGKCEIWLKGLTIGKLYVVAIDTGCIVLGQNSSFEVRSSETPATFVGAQPPFQTLLLMIEPDTDMALVTVEPRQLDSWSFYGARAFQLG